MLARLAWVAPLLLLTLAVCWQAFSLVGQNFLFHAAQTELGFWGREDYRPTEVVVARTGRTIESLLAQAPQQPDYLELKARYLAWQGYQAQEVDERLDLNREAMQSQYQAQQARPAHRQGWEKLLQYAARTLDGGAMMAEAEQRIADLQPAG